MAAYQYVTLVASGGTPVRLANQRGAVLPTTGTGSLVFANGPVLNNPTLNGAIFISPFGFGPGTLAQPSLYFLHAQDTTTGIWSAALGTINFAASGAPLGSATLPGDWTFVRDIAIGRNVTSGTWQGTPVGPIYGGTGLAAYTTGDILYASAANTLARQGIGTTGQVLSVVAGIPTWASIGAVGVASFSAGTTGLTPATSTMGAVTLAGTLAITNGGTGVTAFGAVTSKTANYQLLATDSYKDFDNNAATGSVTFTLPAAAVGLAFGFAVMAAQTLEILAPSGVTIYLGELASSAGGNLQSSTPGSYVFLKCRSSTVWIAETSTGSWTPS